MNVLANSPSARDIAYVMHPFTNLEKHRDKGPTIIERAEGVYVYDTEGKAYIEGLAGLWCVSLGYGEKRLIDVATKQMTQLPFAHMFTHMSSNPAIDLAEKLVTVAPVPMSKVFFCNSGSEAADTAAKLVWYYNNALGRPEKKKIIARMRGYHGTTIASASLTGLPLNHADFDLPIRNIIHTDCPHHYAFAEPGESEAAFSTRLAASLERKIQEEGPETIAAFIAEPIMGAGGVILPPEGYFEKIQAVLAKYDILMIADEVICGFCRTGEYWGSQTFGIKPDILTCSKALSSGYIPIAAILVNEKVADVVSKNSGKLGVFGHGFTATGHPVAAAVALETLNVYEERDILGRVRELAPILQEGLRAYADHPLVGEVRGVGLIAAVQLVKDKASKTFFDPKQGANFQLYYKAMEMGVILRAVPGDSIAFCPPFIIEPEQIKKIIDVFGQALDATAKQLAA